MVASFAEEAERVPFVLPRDYCFSDLGGLCRATIQCATCKISSSVEHRLILHPVSLVGVLVLGSIGLWRHGLIGTVFGGVAGFALMLALYFLGDWLGRLMAKMRREKWEETALGFGDVNLAGVIGLLAGWPGVIAALFVGILAAGLFSGAYLLWMLVSRRYAAFSSIPYAPFLCFGVVFTFSLGIYLSPSS